MFDLFFDAAMAWNEMGMLLITLVLTSLGGLILSYVLYWKIKSKKVRALIKAVHVVGEYTEGAVRPKARNVLFSNSKYANEVYYSLYEYQDAQGNMVEYFDENGSSIITDKIPGTYSTLLMMPETNKVTSLGYVLPAFGTICTGSGLFVGYQFFRQFHFNIFVPFFVLLGFCVAGFKLFKVYKKISDKDKKEIANFFSKMKSDKKSGFSALSEAAKDMKIEDVKYRHGKGRPLDENEIRARVEIYEKNTRFGSKIGFVLALGLLAGGYYFGQVMASRLAEGIHTKGVVSGIDMRRSSSSNGTSYNYLAIVEFTDKEGKIIHFSDSIGSNHPLYSRGDSVDVIYSPQKPENAIIDRGIWNWTLSFALGGAGVFLLFVTLRHLAGGRRYRGRV